MSNCTPGPWKLLKSDWGNRLEVGDGKWIHICRLYSPAEGDAQDDARAKADARLIVNAPAMLLLLQRATGYIEALAKAHDDLGVLRNFAEEINALLRRVEEDE